MTENNGNGRTAKAISEMNAHAIEKLSEKLDKMIDRFDAKIDEMWKEIHRTKLIGVALVASILATGHEDLLSLVGKLVGLFG